MRPQVSYGTQATAKEESFSVSSLSVPNCDSFGLASSWASHQHAANKQMVETSRLSKEFVLGGGWMPEAVNASTCVSKQQDGETWLGILGQRQLGHLDAASSSSTRSRPKQQKVGIRHLGRVVFGRRFRGSRPTWLGIQRITVFCFETKRWFWNWRTQLEAAG
jgi:hypothetical protein